MVVLGGLCAAPVLSWGDLKWENPTIEITAKPGSEEVTGAFRFVNAGSRPVTITSVQTTCGCTTAEPTKQTYAPGEAGEIRAIFTIGGRTGLQEKMITVATDADSARPAGLMLRVTIPELFTLTPGLLLWRTGESLEEKSAVVSAAKPGTITAVEVAKIVSANVSARIEPVEAGSRYRVVVRPVSNAKIVTAGVSGTVTFAAGVKQSFAVHVLVR